MRRRSGSQDGYEKYTKDLKIKDNALAHQKVSFQLLISRIQLELVREEIQEEIKTERRVKRLLRK